MLYSGISWSADGYEVGVVDDSGRQVRRAVRFGTGRTAQLTAHLRGLEQPVVAVVDSTNGVLDGHLMTAGLAVYRADPEVLPERPLLGSVPAIELALVAQRKLSALTRLERHRGTQTGREAALDAGIAASVPAIDALTRAWRCLSRGDHDRPEIALTFDDGPSPPYTGRILDVLERYAVPATFFCVGLNVGAHVEDMARIREQGHALGNHTWSHPFLTELSRPQLVEQIDRAGEAIAEASGGPVPALFRPPYGSRTPEVVGWLADIGPRTVLWDVETADWAMPGADTISRIVLEQTRPGSVILLHDGGGDRSQTVAALPALIEGLLARGLRFVTADELWPTAPATTAGPGLSAWSGSG
jgi:peptidoglycan/xylan/chitin deacetylase (PgdA/CDA1 family)